MKNENGVYLDYGTETVAQLGRSFAEICIAKCDDGLYRFATRMQYSYGGHGAPITDNCEGHPTYEEAKIAGIRKLLARWPTAWESEPESVHRELKQMREQAEGLLRQPSLF